MRLCLSDVEWLLVILLAVYLAECTCWLRGKAMCFSLVVRRHAPLRWPPFLGSTEAGLALTNPLPWATSFVCEAWPIALGPEGICLPPAGPAADGGRDSQRFVPFEALREVRHEDCRLRLGRRLLASAASAEHAQVLATLLGQLAAASPEDRPRLLQQRLLRATDVAAVAARLAELRRMSRPLRTASSFFFLYAFGFGSFLYYGPLVSGQMVWLYLATLLACWLWTVFEYAACRKALLGEPRGKRWRHTALLLLSPASAMRSAESLLRPGLVEFHPLAVAAVLSSKRRCAALAKPTLLELRHPLPADMPGDPAAGRVEQWFRTRLVESLERALGRAGIEAAALVEPPTPLGDAAAYCPRCHNQFVSARGTCKDCGELTLQPFGQAPRGPSGP
jgi:hypothetical protein